MKAAYQVLGIFVDLDGNGAAQTGSFNSHDNRIFLRVNNVMVRGKWLD
jgi:hypothetical protein